ncbi:MAG: hypothetical protein E7054_03755 [Lentisphaerae bacterium]|nr:hypothetical protein [Lentisphaerota bacterium]
MKKQVVVALLAVSAFILGAAEPVNLFLKRPWRVMRSAKSTVIDNIGKEYHCIGSGKTDEGVFIVYDFKPVVAAGDKIVISAESKLAEVPAGRTLSPSGYAIYVDVTFADNTRKFGLIAPFKYSNHDWAKTELVYEAVKPVKRFNVHLLFRNAVGKASFRNPVMNIIKKAVEEKK